LKKFQDKNEKAHTPEPKEESENTKETIPVETKDEPKTDIIEEKSNSPNVESEKVNITRFFF
jgi:hypothetical protein